MIIDVATGQEREFPIENASDPEWSHDGEKFSFFYSDGLQSGYATANIDGSDIQWLTGISAPAGSPGQSPSAFVESYYHPTTPVWSPDGSQLAYVESDSIYLIDEDGNNKHQISGGCDCRALDWSPDGSQLVAMRNVSSQWLISVIDLADGAIVDLPIIGDASYPAWSPDGSQIVYQEGGYHVGDFTSVVIINKDGSGANTLADLAYEPDWGGLVPLVDGVEFTQAIQELQTLSQLQADLQEDGWPPVPIIAGKPAAMRIYFDEVDQAKDYRVEVSGHFSDDQIVQLEPACSPEFQRSESVGCTSTDFFFTPPAGDWSVRLVVKDINEGVVFDEEFGLTSVDVGEFDVEYLPVCVKLTPGATATCPTTFVQNDAVGLMRKLLPVADDDLEYSRFPVPAMELDAPVPNYEASMELLADLQLRYDLMSLGNLAPDQLAGWLPGGNSGPYAGISHPLWLGEGRQGRVTWQKDTSASDPLDAQHTLIHEIAHNLGRRHTNTPDGCNASDAATDWPYADSTIQEVGFDVAAGTVVLASKFDILSYCSPPGTNIWISPHTYNKLMQGAFAPQGFGVSPAGAPIQQLVVKGSAQADGSAATIESAYVITTSTPADQPHPLGNYCLRTSGGAALDYCFQLNFQEHQSGTPMDSESFSLRMPLPEGTTHVSLAKGFQELDALELSASAPSVQLTEPDELQGEETIEWSGTDGDGDPLKYALMYTPDNGQTWYPIAVDLTDPEFTFDTTVLEGDEILIRVLASDGLNTTSETTGPVTVVHGTERTWGDNNCSGNADPVDALLALRFDAGQPTNTGECPDLGAAVAAGGEGRLWGDIDCTGDVGPIDGLKLLRFDSGLSVAQEAGCPLVGGPVSVSVARKVRS